MLGTYTPPLKYFETAVTFTFPPEGAKMIKHFESGVKNEFRHNVGTAHSTLKYKQIQRTDS